jgi:hypothetical protein
LVNRFPDAKQARSELRRMWYPRTSFQQLQLHWSGADLVMLDVAMELYNGADAQRGFANTADAFNKDIEPPTLVFEGK